VTWERYGDGEPAILLLPTWSIIHSRFWKAQIPYLARFHRVVTFDGRGNGRSDRPRSIAAYATSEFVGDAVAVLDATGTARAVGVGLSMGAGWLLCLAADHPDRVAGAVFVGPTVVLDDPEPGQEPGGAPDAETAPDDGWARWPMRRWRRDWRGFAEFFFARMFSEPHSTKQIEDCVGWALETDPVTITRTEVAPYLAYEVDGATLEGAGAVRAMAARIRCPSLVIHGTDDRITPFESGRRLAELLGAPLVALEDRATTRSTGTR
jgi:pimeloyl-ACP methyl ester carboxylesterase